jgi:hypothetical protein
MRPPKAQDQMPDLFIKSPWRHYDAWAIKGGCAAPPFACRRQAGKIRKG